MALLTMKKVSLIAHQDNRNNLLKRLQDLGAVELTDVTTGELAAMDASENLSALEKRLSEVRDALEIIKKYDENKSGFLTPKPAISPNELKEVDVFGGDADKAIEITKKFADDMNSLKSRRHRLKNRITQLEPYAKFDAPLETLGESTYTVTMLGTIPTENNDKFEEICENFADDAYFELVERHKDNFAVYIVMTREADEQLTGELKYIGFAEAYTKDLYGTPADLIFDYENEFESLGNESDEYEEKARKFADDKLVLQASEDHILNEISREHCAEQLGATGSAFMLNGWIVADSQDAVQAAILDAAPESYIEFIEPNEDEMPPTAMRNSGIIAPFEGVTDMYGVPSSKGVDFTVIMSIFYFLIFGMMMADVAYGILLTVGALVVLRLKKPTGMFKKITTVVMICGISTALWGVFFGNIFSIEGVPSVVNPIEDAMTMLVMCVGIGVIHILFGLGLGAYDLIKRGKPWAAIFDKVSWILVLVGGILFAVGSSIGMYVALAGLVILLFTAGRNKKGILGKAMGGVSSLYDITGYVSDILSYCRIFGMGLATSVIAMVFNTIAGLLMGGVIGYVFGIVILTVGHVFNVGINTLGSFVHTARLQYIEFFSKFYEDGGHAFNPLGLRTKHYRFEQSSK